MSTDIEISVVIPTFNRAGTIGRSIESVLAQTYSAAEIVIVDDGSKDNTCQVVQTYGNKVRYLYKENMGVSAARNRGVNQTTSDWIAFLDSDDYWCDQHLERISEAIKATAQGAALYFSDTMRLDYEKRLSHWDLCGFEVNEPFQIQHNATRWALMRIQPMLTPTTVVNRSAFLEVGGFAEQLRTREDTHLFLKLGLRHSFCAVRGLGGEVTSDGKAHLTRVYDGESAVYLESTIFMYRDLLSRGCLIGPRIRSLMRDRLSASFFSTGRIMYRKKRYFRSMRSLVTSIRVSPLMFCKCCSEILGRRLFKIKTGPVDCF